MLSNPQVIYIDCVITFSKQPLKVGGKIFWVKFI